MQQYLLLLLLYVCLSCVLAQQPANNQSRKLQPLEGDCAWSKTEKLLERAGEGDVKHPPFETPANTPLDVYVGMKIQSIAADSVNSQFRVSGWFRQRWEDSRLAYNGFEQFGEHWQVFEDAKGFPVDPDEVWTPDLVVVNSKDNSFEDWDVDRMVTISEEGVHKEGNVFRSMPGQASVGCQFDLKAYPFDTQVCEIKIQSWAYNHGMLQLKPLANQFDHLTDVVMFSDFVIQEAKWLNHSAEYAWLAASHSELTLQITIVRIPTSYLTSCIGPIALLVALASLTPYIELGDDDEEDAKLDSDRLAFCATILLTEMAVMLIFNEKRGMASSESWLDLAFNIAIILTAVPLFETFVILWMHKNLHAKRISDISEEDDVELESDDETTLLSGDEFDTYNERQRLYTYMKIYKSPARFGDYIFRATFPFFAMVVGLLTLLTAINRSTLHFMGHYRQHASTTMFLFVAMAASCFVGFVLFALWGTLRVFQFLYVVTKFNKWQHLKDTVNSYHVSKCYRIQEREELVKSFRQQG